MELMYQSTRSEDTKVTASQAILKGLADDGGLFVPVSIPKLDVSLEDVSKVQITVNGETTGMVRYNYKLAKLYKADESIVIKDSSEKDSENINVTEEQ